MKVIKGSFLHIIAAIIFVFSVYIAVNIIKTFSLLLGHNTDFVQGVIYEFNNEVGNSFIKFRFYLDTKTGKTLYSNVSYTSYSSLIVSNATENIITIEYLKEDPAFCILSRDLLNGAVRTSEDDKLLESAGRDITLFILLIITFIVLMSFIIGRLRLSIPPSGAG